MFNPRDYFTQETERDLVEIFEAIGERLADSIDSAELAREEREVSL